MHYKQNNKESKRYVQGLRLFGNTLPRGIRGILKKNGYNYSEIISKWNFLVGDEISKCSYPKSMKMIKGNSSTTLVIGVERGNEIIVEYSKKEIINKINSYFGYKLINEIRLLTINSKKKKEKKRKNLFKFSKDFEKKINQVKNKEIKKSLSQLLNAINDN
tara:strand:- start:35 stop:517 length:483 start_codon:yes stop_codon:yes gene_type:complete